jgi:hypothetical protein
MIDAIAGVDDRQCARPVVNGTRLVAEFRLEGLTADEQVRAVASTPALSSSAR